MINLTSEIILIIIGLIWIISATFFDIKTKEVPNWLNFTLIIVVLAFRTFTSIIQKDYWNITNGAIGVGIFFILANLFYYIRLFGGGDAKLLIGLGGIIFITNDWKTNLVYTLIFIISLLIIGFVYGILGLGIRITINWKKKNKQIKKELEKQYEKNRKTFYLFGLLLILSTIAYYKYPVVPITPLIFIFLLVPLIIVFSRTMENTIMIRKIRTEELREGDWIYKDVKIGKNKYIKSNFEGITKNEIEKLRKNINFVTIRDGVAFVPVFLISYILFMILRYSGWSFIPKIFGLF